MEQVDVLVVGGGIVGLATAYQLLCRGVKRVTVIEKAAHVAAHQTGHNSGVLHSGLYYDPQSFKAQIARRGKEAMEAFCQREGVPFEICGKLVVATNATELPGLARLEERAKANGVPVERLDPTRLREREPEASGVSALFVSTTGIVDFRAVCHKLVERIIALGGHVRLNTELLTTTRYPRTTVAETNREPVEARLIVAAGGLQADRVALRLGLHPSAKIIPFRGEYFLLGERAKSKVKGLVYPVANAAFPFLGVHFTRRIGGQVDCGPNAVLSFGRETYARNVIQWQDLRETLGFVGFRRLALRHFRFGLEEAYRSLSKTAFTRALQKLIPTITVNDLCPAPTGIRAQAVTPAGDLVHDFLIEEVPRLLCVLNAPSPAATASLEIGRVLSERALVQLG